MVEARLIIDPPSPGPWNMAVDEVLLVDAVENSVATLRFYQWTEPTLSLGYFQRCADRNSHAPSGQCPVVRRQSGGGAILHDRELTYSLVLPGSLSLTRDAEALYERVHTAFISALNLLKDPASRLVGLGIRGSSAPAAREESFLCFLRQSPGDVVLESESKPFKGQRWKILGSAQRRHRGAILQHGSLLLERSAAAPELPGVNDLTEVQFLPKPLISAVSADLGMSLGMRWTPTGLSSRLNSKATELAKAKFGSSVWTNRR